MCESNAPRSSQTSPRWASRRRGGAMVTSCNRAFHLAALAALLTVLLTPLPSDATCDPSTEPDRSDIANARAAVVANCPCDPAVSHSYYVSCAAGHAGAVLVNKSCAGAAIRCAARSTCGRPGFVTCCRTRTKYGTLV